MTNKTDRVIEIEPITRVEGHGKITIHLDEDNNVSVARLHIVEFRGFERFIEGRLMQEVPVLVQRLCGICPVSHHLVAAKAMDQIIGAHSLTPTADKMRRLMHYGQVLQSNALHFFHLASPDLLFGFDADKNKRNIFEVLKQYPDLAIKGVKIRKFGQEIIKHTAGKKIHGTSAIPGGVNKNLSISERDSLLKNINDISTWCLESIKLIQDYSIDNITLIKSFANFKSNYLSLIKDDALELYDGKLKCITADGDIIFDNVESDKYGEHIIEAVRPWTYMKFPFLKSLGEDNGWFRVGPLARMNTCSYINTPLANNEFKKYRKFVDDGNLHHASLLYHWARLIEILHCVEKIEELLLDNDLQGKDLVTKGERQENGIGIIEAPRGTLHHHYKVDENDQVTYCNLVVSTTHNSEAMNRAVTNIADQYISKQKKITEPMLNHLEVAVRAYDPCLSCATHALGQMPLSVELFDYDGYKIDSNSQYV